MSIVSRNSRIHGREKGGGTEVCRRSRSLIVGHPGAFFFRSETPRSSASSHSRPRTSGPYRMTSVAALRARPSHPRDCGLWTLPGLPVPRTRKRTRAHSTLDAGKRPPAPTAPWKTGQTDGRFPTSVHRPRLHLVSTHEGRAHVPGRLNGRLQKAIVASLRRRDHDQRNWCSRSRNRRSRSAEYAMVVDDAARLGSPFILSAI
jgi:hypothetical protein